MGQDCPSVRLYMMHSNNNNNNNNILAYNIIYGAPCSGASDLMKAGQLK